MYNDTQEDRDRETLRAQIEADMRKKPLMAVSFSFGAAPVIHRSKWPVGIEMREDIDFAAVSRDGAARVELTPDGRVRITDYFEGVESVRKVLHYDRGAWFSVAGTSEDAAKREAMLEAAYRRGVAAHEQETALVAKSRNLVTLLDDAEINHGGLWSGKTMRARDDLRLELAKWGKP